MTVEALRTTIFLEERKMEKEKKLILLSVEEEKISEHKP